MKKSTYLLVSLLAFIFVIIGYTWLQNFTYVLPLPINKPENLTYIRIDNYENNTAKFITEQADIVSVAEILNNSTNATEKADNQDRNVQYAVFITDGNKSYTYTFYDQYISCEGHWFKNPYDAVADLREIYDKLNYDTKAISK